MGDVHDRLRVANAQTLRDMETGRAVRAVQGMARALGHFQPNEGVILLAMADAIQALGDGDAAGFKSALAHVRVVIQ